MSPTSPADDASSPVPTTLGDLLYPDSFKIRVQEADWVGLLREIAAGDQRALYAIYARTHRLVFTYVVRIVKSRETAEEVTVDIFHELWKRAESYEPGSGTVVGWIMNLARSRAIDRLRFDQRKKRTGSAGFQESHSQGEAERADQLLEAEDRERRVRMALAALTPHERLAVETAFFSECTYLETAVRLNQPLGTVKTRIRSALGKLREILIIGSEES